jgi:hypothetical protein
MDIEGVIYQIKCRTIITLNDVTSDRERDLSRKPEDARPDEAVSHDRALSGGYSDSRLCSLGG